MEQFEEKCAKIEKLRRLMHELIEQEKDLSNPNVILISQMLDEVLNEYYELLSREKNKK